MTTYAWARRTAPWRAPQTFLALAALIGTLAVSTPRAQGGIWIVDELGGPGAHFTDIPEAVAAALPGDSVVVRPGTYTGFVVDKGIAILGQPGAKVSRPPSFELVTIRNVSASASCTLSGLEVIAAVIGIAVTDCPGTISLENLVVSAELAVNNCAQVSLRRCSMTTARVTDTTAAYHDCSALRVVATGSDLVLSRCTVNVPPVFGGQPGEAVSASGSRLTVTGDGSGGYSASPTRGYTIAGSGELYLDDDVPLSSSETTPIFFTTTILTSIPSLTAIAGAIGGTVTIDLFSEPQDLFFLFVGFPGHPVVVPGLRQRLWIDPAFLPLIRAGVLGASARFAFSVRTPSAPSLVGVPLMWQAVAGQLPSLGFSNAPVYVHGM